jgi:hypothetical protein
MSEKIRLLQLSDIFRKISLLLSGLIIVLIIIFLFDFSFLSALFGKIPLSPNYKNIYEQSIAFLILIITLSASFFGVMTDKFSKQQKSILEIKSLTKRILSIYFIFVFFLILNFYFLFFDLNNFYSFISLIGNFIILLSLLSFSFLALTVHSQKNVLKIILTEEINLKINSTKIKQSFERMTAITNGAIHKGEIEVVREGLDSMKLLLEYHLKKSVQIGRASCRERVY